MAGSVDAPQLSGGGWFVWGDPVVHGDAARRRRGGRRAVVAGLIAIFLLTLVAASALASSGHPPAPITAVDPELGHRLAANPAVRRGERVVLTAPGFAGRARVAVGLVGFRDLATVTASHNGVAVYVFTLPRWLGRGGYELIFSGAAGSYRRGPPQPLRSGPRRAPAVVQVTVPYHPTWRFRVVAGRLPRSRGVPNPHTQGHGTSAHETSQTGADLLATLIFGAALLLAGLLLVVAGRRRLGRRQGGARLG